MPKLKDIAAMKRERQKLIDEMRTITAAAEARTDHKMTPEEAQRWEVLNADVDARRSEIERAERMNQLEMEGGDSDENRDASGDGDNTPETRGFTSFGEFLGAVRSAETARINGSSVDSRLIENRAGTGVNTVDPEEGGFLVQTDHQTEIVRRMYGAASIAGRCQRRPIGPNSDGMTWNELKEASRATGYRHGGIRAYWAGQGDQAGASQPKWEKKRLDLGKLLAFVYATEEALRDTTNLAAEITDLVSDELAYMLDDAIFASGTGVGMPSSILGSKALVTVNKETGQDAKTIVYENILNMWSRLWVRSVTNAVWFINQDCTPQLGTMALVIGAGGMPVYLPASGATASPYSTLFGRPVIPIEQAKTLGTIGDISLFDMSQYRIIEKGGMDSQVSMHVRFLNDEQVFRFRLRISGCPLWSSALTPANGSNQVSPFVALQTRG